MSSAGSARGERAVSRHELRAAVARNESDPARLARPEIRREQRVDVGVWHQAREPSETSVRLQALRRTHEAGPCGNGQRTADADPSDAEGRDVETYRQSNKAPLAPWPSRR